MKKVKAFIDTPITKERFINHIKWHQDMDMIERGHYGEDLTKENFKGCAVGCSLNSVRIELDDFEIETNQHKLYEKYLGIPEWLARVEDRIFEGVSKKRSKKWVLEFSEAVNVGADLNKIKIPFLIMVTESVLEYVQEEEHTKQKFAIENIIEQLKKEPENKTKLLELRRIAYTAAHVADATYAVDAAYTAAHAAYAAVADAAAYDVAAYGAYAAYTADASRVKKYEYFADKLLELMRDCKHTQD